MSHSSFYRDRKIFLVLVAMGIVFFAFGCKHGQCKSGPTSSAGTDDSHNQGRNCQSCHTADGEGPNCWTVAGTIYDASGSNTVSNARVILFEGPLGQNLRYSWNNDDLGNVYTSDDVAFGNGLFPAVISAAGDTSFMTEPIRMGACNSCHGQSTAKIMVQ